MPAERANGAKALIREGKGLLRQATSQERRTEAELERQIFELQL